jgi:Concanavalin A-like lectin/glucanases superfamily
VNRRHVNMGLGEGNYAFLLILFLGQGLLQHTYAQTGQLSNFPNVTKTMFDGSYTITPPNIQWENDVITYSSSNLNVATIDGTTVTIVGPGTTTITASQHYAPWVLDADGYFNLDATLTVNAVSVVTSNGEITTTKTNYVNRYGALGGMTGVSANGAILVARSSSVVMEGLVVNLDNLNTTMFPQPGSTWLDLSGNMSDGTLNGGATYDSANGGSIVFDGSTGYVSGNITPFASADFTVDFWINPATSLSFNNQISLNSNFDWGTFVYHNGDSGGVYVGTHTGSRFDPIGSTMTTNVWNHCTFTFSTSKAAFYVNGVLIESAMWGSDSLPQADISSYFIGQPNNNTIDGKVAVFRIYSKALSSAEVLQNFMAQKSRFGL